MKVWIPHHDGLPHLGELPPQTSVEILPAVDAPMPSDPAEVDFWVPPMLATAPVVQLVPRLRRLSVIQLLSAGAEVWVGQVPDGVLLCDARGVHTVSTSEWVLTAILSYLRAFPAFARQQAARVWLHGPQVPTGELAGRRVLIVGAGDIGEATAARLAPFEVSVTKVARTARPGVHPIDDLPGLLPSTDVVVLLVPLTAATRGLVDARFLARLPDGALLVNASRGPVVRTDDLVAELCTGRIGAALDVTDPEPLPPDSPLWGMPNVLLTPHVGGAVRALVARGYRLVGDQIRRYAAGEPLVNVVREGY